MTGMLVAFGILLAVAIVGGRMTKATTGKGGEMNVLGLILIVAAILWIEFS